MSGSSSFSLNYPAVEEAVSSSNNLIKNINQLSETIRSYTNQIVSARGFSEYVGGISVDTFSGLVNECSTAISTTVLIIRNTEVQLLAYSENESDIRSFLDGLSNKEFNELNLTPLDKYISVDMRIGRAFTGLFASAGAFAIGVVEGGLEFLETGADLLVLGAGMSGSLIASLFDTEYSSKIMEDTRAFVSVNRVESAFNDFYENDSLGQSIVNNAYNFELCRSVGVGVGYSSALIGTSMLTGGLAAGGGIASIGQAGTVTVGRMAATAGIMGFSRGTEDAWNDGATTGDGLLYGAANAGWEATQWAIGARINQFGGFGDQIAKTVGGNAAQGIASRAALDTVDSGVEGFVQPALTMLYRDYGGGSFQENYSRAFEASGGWENVKSQAILGGVMSLGSELGDLRGVLESANESSGTISSINTDSTVHFVTEERFAPTSLGDAIVDLDSFSSAVDINIVRPDVDARVDASGAQVVEGATDYKVEVGQSSGGAKQINTGANQTLKNADARLEAANAAETALDARTAGASRQVVDSGRMNSNADVNRVNTTSGDTILRAAGAAEEAIDVINRDVTRVDPSARIEASGRPEAELRSKPEADVQRVDTTTRTNVEARADTTGRVETSAKPGADIQRVDTTTRANSDAGTIHTNNASELAGAVALADTSPAIRNADIIDASATVGTGLGVADLGVSLLKSGDNVDIDVSLRPDIDTRIDSGRLETDVRVGTGDSPVIDGRIDGDSGHVYNIHDLVEGDSVGDVPLSALDYMLSKDDVTSYLSDFQGEEMLRPFHDLHERVQTEGIQVDGKLSEMLSVLDDRYVETIGNNDLYSQIRSRHSVLDDNRMTLELEERVRQLRPIEDLGEADLYRAEVSSVVADRGKFSLDQEFDVEAGRRYTQDLNAVTVITPTQTVSRFNDISENGLIGSGHHDTNFEEISRAVYGSDFGYSGTSGQDIKIRYVNHVDSKGQRLEVTAQIPLTINSSQLRSLETLNAELKGYSARTGQDIIINASVNDFNGTTGLLVREVSEGVPSFDDILGKVIVDDNAPLAHQEQFLVGRPNVENHFNDSSFDISTRTFREDISSGIDTRVDASGRPDAEISRLDTSSRSKAEADDVVFVDDVTTVGNRYEHRNTDDFRVQRVHDDGTPYYNSDGSRAKPPISHDDLVEIINRNSDSRIESGTRVENEIRTKADAKVREEVDAEVREEIDTDAKS